MNRCLNPIDLEKRIYNLETNGVGSSNIIIEKIPGSKFEYDVDDACYKLKEPFQTDKVPLFAIGNPSQVSFGSLTCSVGTNANGGYDVWVFPYSVFSGDFTIYLICEV